MGWAATHIEKLRRGETVRFRPTGHSMSGRIESGQLVTVEPATTAKIGIGEIVLCKVNGEELLHLVKARRTDGQLMIGNNRGKTNGWTRAVFGRVTAIES